MTTKTFVYQTPKQTLEVTIFDASKNEKDFPHGVIKIGEDINAAPLFIHIDSINGRVQQIFNGDGIEMVKVNEYKHFYNIFSKEGLAKIEKYSC